MTHIGKIARLPKAILDQLNLRLENNELGQPILAWLNDLPEVRQILATLFDGVPVSKHNLSQWRRTGFREWQARQDALKMIADMSGTDGLQPSDGEAITDKLAPWLAIHYFVTAKAMLETDAAASNLKLVQTLCSDFTALRRADHRSARLKLDQDRLTFKQEQTREIPSQPHAVAPSRTQSHPVEAGKSFLE